MSKEEIAYLHFSSIYRNCMEFNKENYETYLRMIISYNNEQILKSKSVFK